MAYYIYETWKSAPRKAIIHEGACVYCNDGEGTASDDTPDHAEWHGPFKSLTEAIKKSNEMKNVVEHKECGRCMKSTD